MNCLSDKPTVKGSVKLFIYLKILWRHQISLGHILSLANNSSLERQAHLILKPTKPVPEMSLYKRKKKISTYLNSDFAS